MAREELKWQNIDADDLPADVKKSFDAMVEAEAAFKADLENLLKAEGHMPEDKFLVMSRKGKRLGVAYASTPRGEGAAASLKFKSGPAFNDAPSYRAAETPIGREVQREVLTGQATIHPLLLARSGPSTSSSPCIASARSSEHEPSSATQTRC